MNTDDNRRTATKRAGDAAAILALLRQRPQSTYDLARQFPGSYRQRLSDLRADGWIIKCRRTEAGSVFTLAGHKTDGQMRLAV